MTSFPTGLIYRLTENIAVVGSNLSGVGKSVRDLFENISSVVLASETRATIAKVVLGSGANQGDAKNLCAVYYKTAFLSGSQ
jgi:hypothetical protein